MMSSSSMSPRVDMNTSQRKQKDMFANGSKSVFIDQSLSTPKTTVFNKHSNIFTVQEEEDTSSKHPIALLNDKR